MALDPCCVWTTSSSRRFDTMVETIVGMYRGIESLQGLSGGAKGFRPSTRFGVRFGVALVANRSRCPFGCFGIRR